MSAKSRKKDGARQKNRAPQQPKAETPPANPQPVSANPTPSRPIKQGKKPRLDQEKRVKDIVFYTAVALLAVLVTYGMVGSWGGKGKKTAALSSNGPASTAGSTLTNSALAAPAAQAQRPPSLQPPPPAAAAPGPRIQFDSTIFDFGKLKVGALTNHSYIFTNTGDRLLEITAVHPGCGCTTAGEWTKEVPPGQTGSIPIQFNSANFSGVVGKSLTVNCNDANQSTVVLQIKGNVWHPVEVTPRYVTLNIFPDTPTNASTVVRIVNNTPEPLTVSNLEVANPAMTATLRTNQPGKEYELFVETASPLPTASVQGQIRLKTSSAELPVVNLSAFVNVLESVTAMPSQVTLSGGPNTNQSSTTIVIRNNSTNRLVLSEPMVTDQTVKVDLREVEKGRQFHATLTFPPDFEVAPTNKVEFSVKSDHPKYPVLRVPIVQLPRRVAPAGPVKPVAVPVQVPVPGE